MPMPKHSTPLAPPREGDLLNRNPLLLKDRGDGFIRDKIIVQHLMHTIKN
jgi:hypothetical protein